MKDFDTPGYRKYSRNYSRQYENYAVFVAGEQTEASGAVESNAETRGMDVDSRVHDLAEAYAPGADGCVKLAYDAFEF